MYPAHWHPPTTHKQYVADARHSHTVENGEMRNGVKAAYPVLLIKSFNIVVSFVVDYMHGVLLCIISGPDVVVTTDHRHKARRLPEPLLARPPTDASTFVERIALVIAVNSTARPDQVLDSITHLLSLHLSPGQRRSLDLATIFDTVGPRRRRPGPCRRPTMGDRRCDRSPYGLGPTPKRQWINVQHISLRLRLIVLPLGDNAFPFFRGRGDSCWELDYSRFTADDIDDLFLCLVLVYFFFC